MIDKKITNLLSPTFKLNVFDNKIEFCRLRDVKFCQIRRPGEDLGVSTRVLAIWPKNPNCDLFYFLYYCHGAKKLNYKLENKHPIPPNI